MSTDTTSLAPASAFPPRPHEIQLKDLILGTAVGLTEWISRELKRLQENQTPRHCHDYEALMEIIDDPTRFQIHTLPPTMNIPPPPSMFVSSGQDDEDEGEDEGEEDYEEDCGEEDCNDTDSITTTTTTTSTNTTTTAHTITEPTRPISPSSVASASPPLWLCKVFAELMRYCNRTSKQVSAPRLLIFEFEKIRNDVKLGNTVDVHILKEKLLTILFGKIQMPQHLVPAWKKMCEWVHTSMDEQSWLKLTLNALFVAQKLCITELVYRRQQLQKAYTKS